jgi:hypothetical protein
MGTTKKKAANPIRISGRFKINSLELTDERFDFNVTAHAATIAELHSSSNLRKQGVVLADTDVRARFQPRATLTDDDGTARNELAAENFYAKPLGIRIATIFRTA